MATCMCKWCSTCVGVCAHIYAARDMVQDKKKSKKGKKKKKDKGGKRSKKDASSSSSSDDSDSGVLTTCALHACAL